MKIGTLLALRGEVYSSASGFDIRRGRKNIRIILFKEIAVSKAGKTVKSSAREDITVRVKIGRAHV